MCRPKELGGRRCPSHSDPVKHAAYNAHRRGLYALKKGKSKKTDNTVAPVSLLDAGDLQSIFSNGSPQQLKYFGDADMFRENVKANSKDADLIIEGLNEYTTTGYHMTRDYLVNNGLTREGRKLSKEDIKYAKNLVLQMDKGFKFADPADEPRTLYRGMRVPEKIESENIGSWVEEHFPAGGVISQKNYMSTTHNPLAAVNIFSSDMDDRRESIVFEISSRNGATLGKGTSSWGDKEAEVLMPRDARFKVVSVERNKTLTQDARHPELTSVRTVIRLIDAE